MEHEMGHVEEETAPEDSADVDEAKYETPAKTRGNNVEVKINFNVDVKEHKTPVQAGLTTQDQSLVDALASAQAALDSAEGSLETDDTTHTSESSTNTTEVAHDHSHIHIMLND